MVFLPGAAARKGAAGAGVALAALGGALMFRARRSATGGQGRAPAHGAGGDTITRAPAGSGPVSSAEGSPGARKAAMSPVSAAQVGAAEAQPRGEGANPCVAWAVATAQGRRAYQEDRFGAVLVRRGAGGGAVVTPAPAKAVPSPGRWSFSDGITVIQGAAAGAAADGGAVGDPALLLAVFDGHGGAGASSLAARELPSLVDAAPERALGGATAMLRARTAERAMRSVVGELERRVVAAASPYEGTTAVLAAVVPPDGDGDEWRVVTANVGDSRAVLARGARGVALTVDHKPEDAGEARRIARAGGTVAQGVFGGVRAGPARVFDGSGRRGGLAMSRAIGDNAFKDARYGLALRGLPLVSAEPDVRTAELVGGADALLLLASDGVWDVLSNDAAVETVRAHGPRASPATAAAALVRRALALGSEDNVTVVVARLNRAGAAGGDANTPVARSKL